MTWRNSNEARADRAMRNPTRNYKLAASGPAIASAIYQDDGHEAHIDRVMLASGGKGFSVLIIPPTYRVRA